MTRKLALSDEILLSIDKPARYTGGEYNSYNKDMDCVDVNVAFCFPDQYEIGTANLGMQIIYEQFNRRADSYCDRVYSPWVDLDKIMREKHIPLFGVESQRPIKDFDFFLISMGYEMCYTNVLQVIDLAQIPLLAEERTEEDPIVVGGGVCTYNPEPMAPFFDVMYIGESETQYDNMVELYKKCRAEHLTRTEILKKIAGLPGLYVPRFYTVTYKEDGTIASFGPNDPCAPARIVKQLAVDIADDLPYPHRPIVPYSRGMSDRAMLEIMRGCIRGCRFCQAGMVCRPVRNRNVEYLKKLAVEMLESTGYDEINLNSLSTSDYSELPELVDFLIDYCDARKINIGIPSLRIDSFSLDVMSKIQDIRKSVMTFAPEAGSQRMRDVINKGLTEEDILNGAAEAFKGGWSRVKLYFMLGQPFETDEDVLAIMELCNKIAAVYYETVPKEERNGRCQIQASTSFFVPKPFTPFQWAPMNHGEEFLRKAYMVKDSMRKQLNAKSLQYHYHEDDQTELEGIFARGDRRLAPAIMEAYKRGCLYDAWGEYLKYDVWMQVFEEMGISLDFYNYRERPLDEILPWDFIDTGVSRKWLENEWKRASQAKVTPNCRQQCAGCGVRKFGGGVCYESQI